MQLGERLTAILDRHDIEAVLFQLELQHPTQGLIIIGKQQLHFSHLAIPNRYFDGCGRATGVVTGKSYITGMSIDD